YALVVEAVDHLADVLRPALDDRAVLVLIAKHQAVIAAGELLQARAHALPRRAGDEHLFHQPVDLLRRERNEPGRRLLTLAALAHLGVVVVADAVRTPPGLLGDALEHRLERQALLLRFVRRLPQHARL